VGKIEILWISYCLKYPKVRSKDIVLFEGAIIKGLIGGPPGWPCSGNPGAKH